MIVRIEPVYKTDNVLVIDENDKFIGEVHYSDFVDCLQDEDGFEEDGYLYFTVSKPILLKILL